MTENLWTAAQISLLGMGLVFGAILLLWGVLALLVRLTAEREPAVEATPAELAGEASSTSLVPLRTGRAHAAAAAVAAALALKATSPTGSNEITPPGLPPSTVSAWQTVTRAAALNARRPRR
jgi:hypothetical protein